MEQKNTSSSTTDIFDKSLHYLGQTTKPFVINIGAMDGVLFDEMYAYSSMYNFNGLYVEPIPYLFDKLKNNFGPHNLFENSAIADYNGEIEMIMIDQTAIDNGKVHQCFYGMSAVYPPKNGLGREHDKPTVQKYGKLIKVACITFETLMKKHNISSVDVIKMDAEGCDYNIFKQIDLSKYKPKVIRLEWINLSDNEQKYILDTFDQFKYIYEINGQDITAVCKSFYDEMVSPKLAKNIDKSNIVTLVTGLWDIGRSTLSEDWSRSFGNYLEQFKKLLKINNNLIIFGDAHLETVVWKHRQPTNTMFILKDTAWFKNNEFYDKIQTIRTNPEWYNQAEWLKKSTQAKLDMYNPVVMSKMFLLNDARILDKFDSDYMYWIDAGITFTVHPGYFTHDLVFDKLSKYISKFTFVAFPYDTNNEIHGFKYNKICEFANNAVKKVARGGFFGGPKNNIAQLNSIYYGLLKTTLNDGYMGTEESIFSIIIYKYCDTVNHVDINSNGLLCTFFENLKNDSVKVLPSH